MPTLTEVANRHVTSRSRLASISAEINSQNARAVGSPTGIASKLGNYEGLLTEQESVTVFLGEQELAQAMARDVLQRASAV